jgi:hypothetical protein
MQFGQQRTFHDHSAIERLLLLRLSIPSSADKVDGNACVDFLWRLRVQVQDDEEHLLFGTVD